MIFRHRRVIDEAWKMIAEATVAGKLGCSAKVINFTLEFSITNLGIILNFWLKHLCSREGVKVVGVLLSWFTCTSIQGISTSLLQQT